MDNKRLYPISERDFNETILPIIEKNYIWKGRPPKISHYKVFCAILYILRTGIPCRYLPKEYGYWHTVFLRYHRGCERNLWWKILNHLLDINIVMCDSASFRIHRHHGGGLKKGQQSKGKSRAGRTITKFHLCSNINNIVIEGFLTGGNTHDVKVANELTKNIVNCKVLEDKGYDSNKNRQQLLSNNNKVVIPPKKNRKVQIEYNKELYKKRGVI